MTSRPKTVGRKRRKPAKAICCHFCHRRLEDVGWLHVWDRESWTFRGRNCQVPADWPRDGYVCKACLEGLHRGFEAATKKMGWFLRKLAENFGPLAEDSP